MKNYIKEYFETRKARILKELSEKTLKIERELYEKLLEENKKHLETVSDIVEKDFAGVLYLPQQDKFLDFKIKDYKIAGEIVGYKNGIVIEPNRSRYGWLDTETYPAILVEDLQKFKKELAEKKEKEYLESIRQVISYVPKKIEPSPKQTFEEIVLKSFENVKGCYYKNQDGSYKLFKSIHISGNAFAYDGTVTENDFEGVPFENILKEYINNYKNHMKRIEVEPSEIIVKIDKMLKGES